MDNPRQLFQDLRSGDLCLEPLVLCAPPKNHVLIETHCSLISPGTERMLTQFGKANLLQKARSQPEKVRQVMSKIKMEGLLTTIEKVKSRLSDPMPLGYSNAGHVIEAGYSIDGILFKEGERVLSNGPHASLVCVPANLCARIPDSVTDEEAVFGVLGAVALHGIRLLEPTLGETFAVCGLGSLGLLAVQILKANGCAPLGMDTNPLRVKMCEALGIPAVCVDDQFDATVVSKQYNLSHGMDGALICAASDKVSLLDETARLCRKKGRIVLTGTTKMEFSRTLFFQKELSFQVSCSYGPGRYDVMYEDRGYDYPLPYVRWTEQRNFETILKLMENKTLKVLDLITHRYAFPDAIKAYEYLNHKDGQSLGILLEYPFAADKKTHSGLEEYRHIEISSQKKSVPSLSVIGAGLFAKSTLLPALSKTGFALHTLSGGKTGAVLHQLGKKYGFGKVSGQSVDTILKEDCDAVAILTRHASHARYIINALENKKAVYCEKPMCLTVDEWRSIDETYRKQGGNVLIGFNRRFSPHVIQLKDFFKSTRDSKHVVMTINALSLPRDHWLLDVNEGGGRLMGEGCHFVDLAMYICDDEVEEVYVSATEPAHVDPCFHIELKFKQGSVANIHYLTTGIESFPKEQMDVFSGGRVCRLLNFRETVFYATRGIKSFKTGQVAKGHTEMLQGWYQSVKDGTPSPLSFESLSKVQLVLFACQESLHRGSPVSLPKFISGIVSEA